MPDADAAGPGTTGPSGPSGGGELPGAGDFARVAGSPFIVEDDLGPGARVRALTVDHVEVKSDTEGRCFSVFFSAPGPDVLPQRIYHLRHEELGALALFLVPLGMEAGPGPGAGSVVRYEAVFNRLTHEARPGPRGEPAPGATP